MSDKNVILVLKYCIFDRTIFGAIKSFVTYALPITLMHFTPYTSTFFRNGSTVLELLMILMIRGCTSLAHPQIIKIINNFETVGRRKNLYKQKILISTFYVLLTYYFYATINVLSYQ